MIQPLLTIAIPTYNRATYLDLSLRRLEGEMAMAGSSAVEILISDNASMDDTQGVIAAAQERGLPVRAIRNASNIGPNANTLACFKQARGHYVLILGDDDLLVVGALTRILTLLRGGNYGVVCLRPYGYDRNDRLEFPGGFRRSRLYRNAGDFLAASGALITFISACIVNKSLLSDIEWALDSSENLIQMHLVLQAALRAEQNLFVLDYVVACKRNNSGGYDFASVFVDEFGRILDQFLNKGLSESAKHQIERRMILSFYPAAILLQRYKNDPRINLTQKRFAQRYGTEALYRWFLRPIFTLPRPLALLWGGAAALTGRVLNGDLRRGLRFVLDRARSTIGRSF